MTPRPREHAVSGAVAVVTREISSPANLSTQNELADLNSSNLSDSNRAQIMLRDFESLERMPLQESVRLSSPLHPQCADGFRETSTIQPRLEYSVFLRMYALLSPSFQVQMRVCFIRNERLLY